MPVPGCVNDLRADGVGKEETLLIPSIHCPPYSVDAVLPCAFGHRVQQNITMCLIQIHNLHPRLIGTGRDAVVDRVRRKGAGGRYIVGKRGGDGIERTVRAQDVGLGEFVGQQSLEKLGALSNRLVACQGDGVVGR